MIENPAAAENPFYRLAPEWALYPLIALATCAAIIASQALISGAYSLTMQAIQLGFMPRLKIEHTSSTEMGQIYIPALNWALMLGCIAIVVGFGSSSNLAAAYGVAVTATMVITTISAGGRRASEVGLESASDARRSQASSSSLIWRSSARTSSRFRTAAGSRSSSGPSSS